MTTLVTGATGFVGAAVVRALLARGEAVRILRREHSDRRNLRGLDVDERLGDLREPSGLSAALDGCDALYHVAADYRLWARNPNDLYASNLTGTENLMRAALASGVQRIVYTSSVATLGLHPDGQPSDEHTPVTLDDMIGHYKRSKFFAEERVRALCAEGLPAVIVNPSTPIGPGDVKPTPTGRVILDAARGKLPAFVDTGLNVVHVDDVAHGHLLAFDRGEVGARYILGGEDLSLQQILGIATARAGRAAPTLKLPHWAVMPIAWVSETLASLTGWGEPLATVDGVRMSRKRMYFSSKKAEHALGYSNRSAVKAIEDAVDWFRAERRF